MLMRFWPVCLCKCFENALQITSSVGVAPACRCVLITNYSMCALSATCYMKCNVGPGWLQHFVTSHCGLATIQVISV